MSERNGHDNLKPPRSRDEARERGALGGKASGVSRRKRKTLREELLALLKTDGRQEKISLALIQRALNGDTKAFEVIRDSIGERPVEQTKSDVTYKFIVSDDECD